MRTEIVHAKWTGSRFISPRVLVRNVQSSICCVMPPSCRRTSSKQLLTRMDPKQFGRMKITFNSRKKNICSPRAGVFVDILNLRRGLYTSLKFRNKQEGLVRRKCECTRLEDHRSRNQDSCTNPEKS